MWTLQLDSLVCVHVCIYMFEAVGEEEKSKVYEVWQLSSEMPP
jgi:hypothetical protein